MVRFAELAHILRYLIHGILLGGELIRLALGFGISEFRRRKCVPHAARRFFAIVFALDDGQTRDLPTAFSANIDVHDFAGGFVSAAESERPSAFWIQGVNISAQFACMLARDLLIATFPNQYR